MFSDYGAERVGHQSITTDDWNRVEPSEGALEAAVAFLQADRSATRGNLMDYMAREGWDFTSANACWVMDHVGRS